MSRGCGRRRCINLWKPCFNCGASVLWYSIFFVLLSQLFNLLQSESVVRSRTNRWQIPLKSSSNYSPKLSICPSVSTLYVQDCSSYMSENKELIFGHYSVVCNKCFEFYIHEPNEYMCEKIVRNKSEFHEKKLTGYWGGWRESEGFRIYLHLRAFVDSIPISKGTLLFKYLWNKN